MCYKIIITSLTGLTGNTITYANSFIKISCEEHTDTGHHSIIPGSNYERSLTRTVCIPVYSLLRLTNVENTTATISPKAKGYCKGGEKTRTLDHAWRYTI